MGCNCGKGKGANPFTVIERAAFVRAVDANASMKTLKRQFKMTKEQVEENIRLLPYHRLFLLVTKETKAIRLRKDLRGREKIVRIRALTEQLKVKWRKLNEGI